MKTKKFKRIKKRIFLLYGFKVQTKKQLKSLLKEFD